MHNVIEDKIERIEARDTIIENKEELGKIIEDIKAYSKYGEIPKENIYITSKEIEDNNYEINIVVKYQNDYMNKKVNCYIETKEETLEDENTI